MASRLMPQVQRGPGRVLWIEVGSSSLGVGPEGGTPVSGERGRLGQKERRWRGRKFREVLREGEGVESPASPLTSPNV